MQHPSAFCKLGDHFLSNVYERRGTFSVKGLGLGAEPCYIKVLFSTRGIPHLQPCLEYMKDILISVVLLNHSDSLIAP